MALDRLHRDVELARDLLVGVAPGDEPQDLALPGRELVELRIDGWRGRAGERVEHEPRQPGREHRVAVMDPTDREGEVGRRDGFGDVSSGAGPDHGDDVVGGIGHRECQEAHARMLRGEGLDHAGSAAIGKVHVEQHHVGRRFRDGLDRLSHGRRVPHDLELPSQLRPNA